MPLKIAVFASGSGSNAENIARYFRNSEVADVALIVSNKPDAYVLTRAGRLAIPSLLFVQEEWKNNPKHILTALRRHEIDFIVLAGFLAFVPCEILQAYPNRIINIHPSLLPKFGGKGMYGDRVHRAVAEAGEPQTGITIHYTNEHYDEGEIIFQATCPVLPGDSPEEIAAKVHELEYYHYPRVIEKLFATLK